MQSSQETSAFYLIMTADMSSAGGSAVKSACTCSHIKTNTYYGILMLHTTLMAISSKTETDTIDGHSSEQRLCYNADIGQPSFERQQGVNREYLLVATRRIRIFLLNLIQ